MIMRSIVVVCVFWGTVCAGAEIQIEVRAGGHDRESCPVTVAIPESMTLAKRFRLVRSDTGEAIPVQRFGGPKTRRLMWMIQERLPAGAKRKYSLTAEDGGRQPRRVTCDDDGKRITLSVEGAPVLHFNHEVVEAPDGIDSVYRRSGYLHPVLTPSGKTVTGDFEKDHPHQHGIFFAWVNATFRDQPVDFWNQAKGTGGVRFERFQNRRVSGPVFGQFTAKLTHYAIRDDAPVPALEETYQVRVFRSREPFLVEITSRQQTISDAPLHVNKYHYGGFALRGPSTWLVGKSAEPPPSDEVIHAGFVTSAGRTRDDGNHTRARWVEMHGPVGGGHAGLIALSAQNNFRAPQTVRLHPNKPYFCFAPMVLGEFRIEPEEAYVSRYRLVIHDGPPDPVLAERMWQDLAHPPKVTLVND